MELPKSFLTKIRASLGDAFDSYLAAMDRAPRRALRANTLKTTPEELLHLLGIPYEPCGTIPEGMFVPEGFAPGKHPLHCAGLFYMQEPSAQVPVSLLAPQPGEAVLDLCAAPGGKSGQIAAMLQHKGLLLSNELVPNRAQILSFTLERLGVRNAIVTSMRPDALLRLLPEQFDAVLVDAPCSGEGMFRRDPQAIADWSPEHVLSCAERQRNILESAVTAVRPGGRLVYSTCTFSREENEDNVRWLLSQYPDFTLREERHLYPHTSTGEGQYAALLVRNGESAPAYPRFTVPKAQKLPLWESFKAEHMTLQPDGIPSMLPDGRVFLLPERVPAMLSKLKVIRAGVNLGEIRSNRFEPAHALFMAYEKNAFRHSITLEGKALECYLAGETVSCEETLKGYVAVCASGHPIGFAKASGGQLKNHLPKGLRLR